jgi:hypothetical protein
MQTARNEKNVRMGPPSTTKVVETGPNVNCRC